MATTSACAGLGAASRLLVTGLAIGLAGCSYFETQRSETVPLDDRIVLGSRERLSLSERETRLYTCAPPSVLVCERGGAVTYSCACAPR